MPIPEYETTVRAIATVGFVFFSVYLVVRLAFRGYARFDRRSKELECLSSLTEDERVFLAYLRVPASEGGEVRQQG